MSGEGLVALVLECLLPGAEEGLVDAEGAGGLGDGVALLGDELDRLGLELGGVGASRSRHDGPPKSEFTLLTGCPPFVGRSKPQDTMSRNRLAFGFNVFNCSFLQVEACCYQTLQPGLIG